jgi:hypothetical protein
MPLAGFIATMVTFVVAMFVIEAIVVAVALGDML